MVFLIGIFQHGLSAGDDANIYTILTIGDGLVSQIPALLTSTATYYNNKDQIQMKRDLQQEL